MTIPKTKPAPFQPALKMPAPPGGRAGTGFSAFLQTLSGQRPVKAAKAEPEKPAAEQEEPEEGPSKDQPACDPASLLLLLQGARPEPDQPLACLPVETAAAPEAVAGLAGGAAVAAPVTAADAPDFESGSPSGPGLQPEFTAVLGGAGEAAVEPTATVEPAPADGGPAAGMEAAALMPGTSQVVEKPAGDPALAISTQAGPAQPTAQVEEARTSVADSSGAASREPLPADRRSAGRKPGPADPPIGAARWEAPAGPGFEVKAQTGPGRPQAPETLRFVTGLSCEIEKMAQSGRSSLALKLVPNELGGIQVALSAAAEGTRVVITADQPAAAALLRQRVDDLRQALVQAGVQINELSIEVGGRSASNSQSQPDWNGPAVPPRYPLPLSEESSSTQEAQTWYRSASQVDVQI